MKSACFRDALPGVSSIVSSGNLFENLSCQSFGILSVVAATVLCSCQTTTLEFRSPEGTVLQLEGNWLNSAREITFPTRETFRQTESTGATKGTPLTGEIRIDEQIDFSRIPVGASKYILKDAGGNKIRVRGYYWIYEYDKTTTDELTTHYVDVTPAQIYGLLEGDAISITGDDILPGLLFKIQIGIELPEETKPETSD